MYTRVTLNHQKILYGFWLAAMSMIFKLCVWFWQPACDFNTHSCDFHTYTYDIHTHACDFGTLRVKLLYYNIHKPKLQLHACGRHAFRINTLSSIVIVTYCVSVQRAYVKIQHACVQVQHACVQVQHAYEQFQHASHAKVFNRHAQRYIHRIDKQILTVYYKCSMEKKFIDYWIKFKFRSLYAAVQVYFFHLTV
jgi:hypothetical protein